MKPEAAGGVEGVGPRFSDTAMLRARDLTFEAVRAIAARLTVGTTEAAAYETAAEVLREMGAERLWHRNVIRFGEGTLDVFQAPARPDRALRPDDIFFIDLGAVWDGHEGDAGDTFTVGDDADMAAAATAARDIWWEVAEHWHEHGATGADLYAYAAARAAAAGWRLNHSVKGHRVSDFPHAAFKAGKLGDLDRVPAAGLWVLEIQIAHPRRPFGAFFEDLLIHES